MSDEKHKHYAASHGKPEESDLPEKLSSFIPSFYYDVIARIIPGGALLAAIAWQRGAITMDLKDAQFGAGAAFLAASYVVGMILTTGAILIDRIWDFCANRHWLKINYTPAAIALAIDKIRRHAPSLGTDLYKTFAEVTCLENLLVAALIISVRKNSGKQIDGVLLSTAGIAILLGLYARIRMSCARTEELAKSYNILIDADAAKTIGSNPSQIMDRANSLAAVIRRIDEPTIKAVNDFTARLPENSPDKQGLNEKLSPFNNPPNVNRLPTTEEIQSLIAVAKDAQQNSPPPLTIDGRLGVLDTHLSLREHLYALQQEIAERHHPRPERVENSINKARHLVTQKLSELKAERARQTSAMINTTQEAEIELLNAADDALNQFPLPNSKVPYLPNSSAFPHS